MIFDTVDSNGELKKSARSVTHKSLKVLELMASIGAIVPYLNSPTGFNARLAASPRQPGVQLCIDERALFVCACVCVRLCLCPLSVCVDAHICA